MVLECCRDPQSDSRHQRIQIHLTEYMFLMKGQAIFQLVSGMKLGSSHYEFLGEDESTVDCVVDGCAESVRVVLTNQHIVNGVADGCNESVRIVLSIQHIVHCVVDGCA